MVDKIFKQMFVDIVGEEFMDRYCYINIVDYIDLFRDFEIKKCEKFKIDKVILKILFIFLEKYKEEIGMDIVDKSKSIRYVKYLKWVGDKIRIDREVFNNFFNLFCEKIV